MVPGAKVDWEASDQGCAYGAALQAEQIKFGFESHITNNLHGTLDEF